MDTTYYLGIDPGLSGGLALLPVDGQKPLLYSMAETEHDISDILREYAGNIAMAAIEKVHSFPGQGVSSTFTFGRNYGFLRGILTALRIPFIDVPPQTWQKDLSCLSKGDKNVTKAKAQALYPALSRQITHKTADSLLIGYWLKCRETAGGKKHE